MEVMQRNQDIIQLFSVENIRRRERKELKEEFVIIIKISVYILPYIYDYHYLIKYHTKYI